MTALNEANTVEQTIPDTREEFRGQFAAGNPMLRTWMPSSPASTDQGT